MGTARMPNRLRSRLLAWLLEMRMAHQDARRYPPQQYSRWDEARHTLHLDGTDLPTPLRVAWQVVRDWWHGTFWPLHRLVCYVRGWHNTDLDDSYAGPDSGWETHRCATCGESWTHVWY